VTTDIDYEATGPNYAVEKLLDVRERLHQAIAAISAKIVPGLVEEDAVAMARGILGEWGMRKGWHRVIVRFGPNTTKDFMADSEPGVVLGEQGPALYDYAVARAKDMGWELNLDLSGHRPGDFPHEALYEDLLLDDQSFGG
jgi:hypothetical protein